MSYRPVAFEPWVKSREYTHVHELNREGIGQGDSAVIDNVDAETIQRIGFLAGVLKASKSVTGWRLRTNTGCDELCTFVRSVLGYSDMSVDSVRKQLCWAIDCMDEPPELDKLEIACLDQLARDQLAELARDCDDPWGVKILLNLNPEDLIDSLVERKVEWEALCACAGN